jgi:Tol biopolymer transport system component
VLRFRINAPDGVNTIAWPRISPDGRTLAFMATDSSGTLRIWVRPMDTNDSRPLPTTEGATRMFWSPDSRSLAYMNQGELRRVSIDGGPSTPIAKVAGGSDGSWGEGAVLLDGNIQDSIRVVPASGGEARPATRIERKAGDGGIAWPSFLPDGKHFLAVASTASNPNGTAGIRYGRLGSLDTKVVGKTDGRVEYSDPGYLVFPRENALMAQRFDAGSGRALGDPVPLAENLGGLSSGGDYSVSRDGILVYRPSGTTEGTRLQWVDRTGKLIGVPSGVGGFGDVALSPEGRRVAYSLTNNNLSEVWVRDLDRGTDQRVTFEGHFEFNPIWSPDGSRIAYSSDVNGSNLIYIRRADGTGERDSLPDVKGSSFLGPVEWSADGARLLARQQTIEGRWDITVYSAPFHDAPKPFTSTPFIERSASISRDGRWIAYESNETGRFEIFVRPADGGAGRWQISVSGGRYPLWRADGSELFFQGPDLSIMSVSIEAAGGFAAGNPVTLFRHDLASLGYTGRTWAVSADGQRFLLSMPATSTSRPHFEVVVNWPQTLRK